MLVLNPVREKDLREAGGGFDNLFEKYSQYKYFVQNCGRQYSGIKTHNRFHQAIFLQAISNLRRAEFLRRYFHINPEIILSYSTPAWLCDWKIYCWRSTMRTNLSTTIDNFPRKFPASEHSRNGSFPGGPDDVLSTSQIDESRIHNWDIC